MRNRFFFVLVLLGAVLGLGVGAIAQNAKQPATAPTTLAAKHAANGVACKSCHETKKPQPVAMTKCLTCHDTKTVAQRTAAVQPTNPHNSRHFGTEADCNACHHQHRKSESLCADCHTRFNFKVP
jgi:Cytochrome c3